MARTRRFAFSAASMASSAAAPSSTSRSAPRSRGPISSASMRRRHPIPEPTADKAGDADLRYGLYSSRISGLPQGKGRNLGARCYTHARFYLSRGRPWCGGSGTSQRSSCSRWSVQTTDQGLLGAPPTGAGSPNWRHRPDGRLRTSRNHGSVRRRSGSSPEPKRRAPIGRVIVLNCYGRGGSGMVWRMIGSSPDVIMTSEEWHVGASGKEDPAKGLSWHFDHLAFDRLSRCGAMRSGRRSKCRGQTT